VVAALAARPTVNALRRAAACLNLDLANNAGRSVDHPVARLLTLRCDCPGPHMRRHRRQHIDAVPRLVRSAYARRPIEGRGDGLAHKETAA
jgi:hypothetical protein